MCGASAEEGSNIAAELALVANMRVAVFSAVVISHSFTRLTLHSLWIHHYRIDDSAADISPVERLSTGEAAVELVLGSPLTNAYALPAGSLSDNAVYCINCSLEDP